MNDGEDAAEAEPVLSAARKAKVQEMWGKWDYNGTGRLELHMFSGASIKIGPTESKVLKTLEEMDFDKDGYVVPAEWERYFALTTDALTDAEFDAIAEDLSESGSHLLQVLSLTALANAEPKAVAPMDDEEAAEAAEEAAASAPEPLSAERLACVEELFTTWDVEKEGGIPLAKLKETKLTFGPNQSAVYESLGLMDTDGDGEVTLDEMKQYFTITSATLSEAEWTMLHGEMLSFAQDASLISKLTEIALEPGVATGAGAAAAAEADEEDEDMDEAPVPLTAARAELVQNLFSMFATNDGKSEIDIAAIQNDAVIDIGPNRMMPLEFMALMDADGDGKVTFDEMCLYFTLVGSALSEDEFALIVNEMIDAASTKSMLKMGLAG